MSIYFREKLIAYLALLSGLVISGVAVYYSVVGLTSIFSAAVVPIIIMGVALEVSKLVATVWLKQNWEIAPWSIRSYLITSIIILMLITSMGIFGFLSKAHLDQSVPTGDVAAKVALIDEKIKTEKENIDAARKAIAQMDAQVNERLSRSTDDRGAERAIQIRRQQAKERTQLQNDIATAQNNISRLNEERAPVASELRKVEAEVGPIKYIASFFYGETDQTILEKAVTWVIIILIVVFDPLAVILLLASQISFNNIREKKSLEANSPLGPESVVDIQKPTVPDIGASDNAITNDTNDIPRDNSQRIDDGIDRPDTDVDDTVRKDDIDKDVVINEKTHPYLYKKFESVKTKPLVYIPEADIKDDLFPTFEEITPRHDETVQETTSTSTYQIIPELQEEIDKGEPLFIQNEEQTESNLWSKTAIGLEDYVNISQEKLEQQIVYYAHLLRNKQIDPKDIPEPIKLEVKARV